MAFFRRVKKRLQGDDPQQLKRELQWLQTQVGRYKGKILAVGLLSLTGTIMGLISSVASKYLIDAVTGYGADMLWRAVAIMAVMLLGSLVLQGVSSRVGGSGNRYPIAAGTRGVFAYVPQGNSVFPGTIAENLRLVSPDATDGELEQALKIACAWDFVSQFPDGVNHRLGTGGRGISEGRAQRPGAAAQSADSASGRSHLRSGHGHGAAASGQSAPKRSSAHLHSGDPPPRSGSGTGDRRAAQGKAFAAGQLLVEFL